MTSPTSRLDGRTHAAEAIAASHAEGPEVVVTSPLVGAWHPALAPGQLVVGGAVLGDVEVLGQLVRIVAPAGSRGLIVASAGAGRGRTPVGHGTALYRLDPDVGAGAAAQHAGHAAASHAAEGLVFTAPTGGRFYGRPGPGKDPFTKAGDVIGEGHTICLLEVMKTFNRVVYAAGGPRGLPPRARVVEVVAADEADVATDDVLLRLEPA